MRNLIIVLGDQLDFQSAVFDGFDSGVDEVWMAEAAEEASYVKCHKQRIVFFFSAMRHFRDQLRVKTSRSATTSWAHDNPQIAVPVSRKSWPMISKS